MGIPKEYSRAKQNVENSVHGTFFSGFIYVEYRIQQRTDF